MIKARVFTVVIVGVLLPGCSGGLSDDERAWCDDHTPDVFDTAMELEIASLDEVAQLLLDALPNDRGLSGDPILTKDDLLGILETEPFMQSVAAAFWVSNALERNSAEYELVCKEAHKELGAIAKVRGT
jgi:hypothetical protein